MIGDLKKSRDKDLKKKPEETVQKLTEKEEGCGQNASVFKIKCYCRSEYPLFINNIKWRVS